MHFDSLQYMFV